MGVAGRQSKCTFSMTTVSACKCKQEAEEEELQAELERSRPAAGQALGVAAAAAARTKDVQCTLAKHTTTSKPHTHGQSNKVQFK